MNAAGRLVHQHVLSRHFVLTHRLNRWQIAAALLLFSVLFSALSMIYVTHTTRMLHANYQHQLIERNNLYGQQGQLLLERSTWMMQARIQHIAEKQLGMVMPDYKTMVIVRE